MFRLRWLTILVGILFAAILSTATITVAARFSDVGRSSKSRDKSGAATSAVPSSTEPQYRAGGDVAHSGWSPDDVRRPHRIFFPGFRGLVFSIWLLSVLALVATSLLLEGLCDKLG